MTPQQSQLMSELRELEGKFLLWAKSVELIDGVQVGGSFVAGRWQVRAGLQQIRRAIAGIEAARERRMAA